MPDWKQHIGERLAGLKLDPRREAEIVEEVAQHLADTYSEARSAGASEKESVARTLAELETGGVLERELMRLEARPAEPIPLGGGRRGNLMANFWQDVRYGWRTLWKSPGFTLVAVLTLALGIGANTVMFSVIYTVLLRPLPYPDPSRLDLLWEVSKKDPDSRYVPSAPTFLDWQRQNHVFEQMAAMETRAFNLADDAQVPAEAIGLRVSSSIFPLLGVKPLLGRALLPEDDRFGNHRVLVLSHRLWRERYGSDPDLVGKAVRVNGEKYTVVGVMPPNFQFFLRAHELWVPIAFTPAELEARQTHAFIVVARRKVGVTRTQAEAELKQIADGLEKQHWESRGMTAFVQPMNEFVVSGYRPMLLALMGSVGFVLLIACANISNLLLARAAGRRQEIAIRAALGASRGRLAGQLLTESGLLGLLGGAAGLVLALWGNRLLVPFLPQGMRFVPFRNLEFRALDGTVLGFTLAISVLVGILFGLLPAWGASRCQLSGALKESGGRGHSGGKQRTQTALVVAEIALALVVLTGAGLMLQTLSRLSAVSPGFDASHVLTVRASLPQEDFGGPAERTSFCSDLEERVGSLPGVVAVSSISHLPVTGGPTSRGLTVEGVPLEPGHRYNAGAHYRLVCPGYFKTMGIPVLRGREFTQQDTASAPGALVVNETFARRTWPEENPIGKRVRVGTADSDDPWLTVVGVVGDIRDSGLDQKAQSQIFRPYPQASWPVMHLVVRAGGDPLHLVEPLRQAMAQIDPEQPLASIHTMDEVIAETEGQRRFVLGLLGIFAMLAVVLAAVGIYGVMAYAVTERRREIGIRVALGAQRGHVYRLVLRQGILRAGAGVVLGVAGAFGLTRFLESLLFGVTARDPVTFCAVAALLIAVALLACYLPARRATRVDPMTVLRYE